MVSKGFMSAYFWITYIWFCIGFLIIFIASLKEAFSLIKNKKL